MVSSRIRLAVVDDHRMLLTALSHWIQEAATDLDLVASVASWPDLLAHPAFPVDVVLLDLDLRDDLPISVKLRALDTVGVRTVLMSTYSDPGVVAEALAAGALGYIVKSESTDTIVLAIRAAMEGTPFVSPGLAPQLQADIGAPRLTAQERRVMALYSTGESAKRMATVLQISEQTAKSHLKRIRAKFKAAGVDVGTKLTLREQAIRTGLILLEDDGPSSSEQTVAAESATPDSD